MKNQPEQTSDDEEIETTIYLPHETSEEEDFKMVLKKDGTVVAFIKGFNF